MFSLSCLVLPLTAMNFLVQGITAILNFQTGTETQNWGINSNSINESCQKFDILMINYPIRYINDSCINSSIYCLKTYPTFCFWGHLYLWSNCSKHLLHCFLQLLHDMLYSESVSFLGLVKLHLWHIFCILVESYSWISFTFC